MGLELDNFVPILFFVDEFNKFISHIDNEVYKQFFNLMYYTGTRPGEAMALRFSDLIILFYQLIKLFQKN